jgi:hypothetical protein
MHSNSDDFSLVAVWLSGAKSNLKTRGGHYFFLEKKGLFVRKY